MPRHVRIADAEGRTDHDEPRFVSVTGSRQHVWIENQYFQETDRDTEVEVGDVFYDTTGVESVYEVIAIDDADSEQDSVSRHYDQPRNRPLLRLNQHILRNHRYVG